MGPLKPKVTQLLELRGLRSSSRFERQVGALPLLGPEGSHRSSQMAGWLGVNARDAVRMHLHTHTDTHTVIV